MNNSLSVIDMPSQEQFLEDYVAANQPVVVRGLDFDRDQWTPEAFRENLGDLTALVYGALFDLEDVHPLEDYLDDWFGDQAALEDEVPYVRWYNKLRDVEFAWGDDAFARLTSAWRPPACLPTAGFVVPLTDHGAGANPVTDAFPYRGVLIAARGARTRLHRDPFCTDAVVCQYFGVKDAALYRPSRAEELTERAASTSFGGFVDVRSSMDTLSVEPDFRGSVKPGEMIYIPHGWLHDVIVLDDSISVTWNFIHRRGATAFGDYLASKPETDSEFEILQYFHHLAGVEVATADEVSSMHSLSQRH